MIGLIIINGKSSMLCRHVMLNRKNVRMGSVSSKCMLPVGENSPDSCHLQMYDCFFDRQSVG